MKTTFNPVTVCNNSEREFTFTLEIYNEAENKFQLQGFNEKGVKVERTVSIRLDENLNLTGLLILAKDRSLCNVEKKALKAFGITIDEEIY